MSGGVPEFGLRDRRNSPATVLEPPFVGSNPTASAILIGDNDPARSSNLHAGPNPKAEAMRRGLVTHRYFGLPGRREASRNDMLVLFGERQ